MTFCHAIPERLEKLRSLANRPLYGADNERAHILEDCIWQAVLEHIARGKCADPQSCCNLALETTQVEYSRWYA